MIARLAESLTLLATAMFVLALAIAAPVVIRRLLLVRRMRAAFARRRAAQVPISRAVADERDLLRVWRARAHYGRDASAIELYAAVVESARNEEGATPSLERLKAIDLLCQSKIWVVGTRDERAS